MIAWEMFLQTMVAMNFPHADTENENSTKKLPLGRIHEKKNVKNLDRWKKIGLWFFSF